jgi:hypothetical protein
MSKSVLIVGEDPDLVDFSAADAPPDMSAQKVMDGLNGSRDRLERAGHAVEILLTRDAGTIEDQVSNAMKKQRYDVVVVGAGLRTLPAMIEQFETLMNAVHRYAPQAKLAFNTQPNDSDAAALRWL